MVASPPGLVNCHHLYQWATRGLAQQATLFEWLVELYPIWALVDEEIEHAAARAGSRPWSAPAARRPWTTTMYSRGMWETYWGWRSRLRERSGSGSIPPGAPWTWASQRAGCPLTA